MSRVHRSPWWICAAATLAACSPTPSEPDSSSWAEDASSPLPDASLPDAALASPDAQQAADAAFGADAQSPDAAALDAGSAMDAGASSPVCACADGGLAECPIQALQNTTHPCFAGAARGVVVADVVVLTPPLDTGFWAGEPGGGPYSGIWVYVPGSTLRPLLMPGDMVTLVGNLGEFYGRTQLTATNIQLTGRGALPPFADVTTAQLCTTCAEAESYEGVLVRLQDVTIAKADLGYGEYTVSAAGGGLEVIVDDLFAGNFAYRPKAGDAFSALSGVFDYSYNSFKIEPRGCDDLIDSGGTPYCPVLVCPTGSADVAQIHDRTRADAVPFGCFVRVNEAVLTTPLYPSTAGGRFGWLQQGSAPHDGLWLVSRATDLSGAVQGSRVVVSGDVVGMRSSPGLSLRSLEVKGVGNVPTPLTLTPAQASGHESGAAGYEGMLVRVQDVVTIVPRAELEFGVDWNLFEVAQASAPAVRVVISDSLGSGFACPWPRLEERCPGDLRAFGQHFASITGVLVGLGEFQLRPRARADLTLTACEAPDADCDDVPDSSDLCPARFDPGSGNVDGDAFGDACDVCVSHSQAGSTDTDGDGVGDPCDLCPALPDPGQENLDGDLLGDACDPDRDGDGVPESGPAPCAGGTTNGCADNCPFVANPSQSDADADGRGDACDGGRAPIALDGRFEDWAGISPAYVDRRGDSGPGGLDLGGLWMADDGRNLYLRVELGRELLLQQDNGLRIYLDTDANAATGLPVAGIGADLEWTPGTQSGRLHGSSTTPVAWAAVGYVGLPTVSASTVELAFGLGTKRAGGAPLFAGPEVRVVLQDGSDGDRLPDGEGGVSFQLGLGAPVAQPSVDLARQRTQDLRIATFNVAAGSPWTTGNGPRFQRLLAAVSPDVLVLQETGAYGPEEAIALVSGAVPGTWSARRSRNNITVTRLPILASWETPAPQLLLLLDATAQLGRKILVGNLHLSCCENVEDRRGEIDEILEALRHLSRESNGLPAGTPYLLAGDLNLVDVARTRDALLRGDLFIETVFGPDFEPDPAGRPLESLMSYVAGTRLGVTWRGSSFAPGFLDYVVYTGSLLEVGNHFVLDTAELSDAQLSTLGLQRSDSALSDHLLRVADFRAVP